VSTHALVNSTRCLALLGAVSAGFVGAAEPMQPYPVKGQIIEEIQSFDKPEGTIFSADGKYVFVSNSSELGMKELGFHWAEKRGYVSKLEVLRDGKLRMVEQRLVTDLTAPLGMAVNTVATKKFPKGAIFLCVGGAPMATPDGKDVKDVSRLHSGILVFDDRGTVLGKIDMGTGSAIAKKMGAPATLPNAADFDKEGNYYVTDTAIAGASFDPPISPKSGVYMFPHDSLDALADGGEAPFYFVDMPEGGPDGLEVAPDGSIHVNTVGIAAGMKDPAEGGMYKLSKDDFKSGHLPAPFVTGLGALDGLTFLGETRLDTEIKNTNSVVITPPGGKPMMLTYDRSDKKLAGPADIAVRKMSDGSYLLLIPELSALTPHTVTNPVTTVRLPADFAK
jgi:hypothetical protein